MVIPCIFFIKALVVIGIVLISAIIIISAVNRYNRRRPRTPSDTHLSEVDYRLSENIKPINYKILLGSFLNESGSGKVTFDGECSIEIKVLKKTNQIQLHIMNLDISLSEYYKKNTTDKKVLPAATSNSLTDIVCYNLTEELHPNEVYILHYVYVGTMNEDMNGYYRSKYETGENYTEYVLQTLFNTKLIICKFSTSKF